MNLGGNDVTRPTPHNSISMLLSQANVINNARDLTSKLCALPRFNNVGDLRHYCRWPIGSTTLTILRPNYAHYPTAPIALLPLANRFNNIDEFTPKLRPPPSSLPLANRSNNDDDITHKVRPLPRIPHYIAATGKQGQQR